jgi:DNA helicase HerA-like ATPase
MSVKATLLGYVGAVSASGVSVRQAPSVASGIAIIGGKSYRIGQVGSFVRIPQGYHSLYGIVSEVGASATPEAVRQPHDHGERWMTVQLVGEIVGGSFERGISQFPNVNDEVHLVTEEDLARVYGTADSGQIVIGRLSNAEGIPVRIDLDKLLTRHCAVLGSTGAGKSTTVASLLRSVALGSTLEEAPGFPSARILLLDIHGEYGQALRSIAEVFRVAPNKGEKALHIPFWALEPAALLSFLMGRLDDKPLTQILDRISDYKVQRIQSRAIQGIDLTSMTVDTPVPFSLKRLWLELIEPEVKTWRDQQRTQPALIKAGDAETLTAPKYEPATTTNTAPYLNNIGVLGIRRPLDQMRSRLLDRQYDFLLHPGPWEPDSGGTVTKDLPDLLEAWIGHDKPITILDLSGIPSVVLVRLIGAILKIIFEGLFWGREKSEGGVGRPLLVVMEEAHRYVGGDNDGPAREMVQRIVKEGRKFGIGAMIVSQRPSEVDETILSQCGTFVALRLSNASDRGKVQAALPDSLAGVVDSLPVLRTGEAIIVGEAAHLPIRCRITLPSEENRPNSGDPEVAKHWLQSRQKKLSEEEVAQMERELVESSTIVSIGYDQTAEILEVEFKNGGTYQYYNLPSVVHERLMESSSKGQFLHANIKNSFPYSRV